MALGIHQPSRAEPCLAQGWQQLGGAIVGNNCTADVAQFLQRDAQSEIRIGIVRIGHDRPLKRGDGLRYAADLEASEAEIVMDDGIRWLQPRRVAQRRDRIGWLTGLELLRGRCKQEL